MSTIQLVLDDELLAEADALAAREGGDRAGLILKALRDHLRREKIRELEEEERLAYQRIPDTLEDWEGWEKIAAWPDD